ncbi:isoprenylcysteine carboxyl methyltransferase family protein [Alkalibacillus haloalkaliphilus]|uniref:isoprenylcysteine carboxyl methyltransferase family protein n=1 Tax=Alkalibacillus haloalkaliphilus TaxID=94136 RepID=UPI002936C159|nr:isoprenylcysteine carboxylmethyltransferase family protein [Alkalibacillus haloalkaliphilus]MDV2580787.1 isoprenylcysteine carboxylmethyltransferase family protein [Alkalibacillus haloalkaliphilus]
MIYILLLIYLISLRLLELAIAKSNARYQIDRGAVVVSDRYYPLIVTVHVLFIISLITESYMSHQFNQSLSVSLLIIFIFLQVLRFWVILSLGRYWNTKVIINPSGGRLVKKGLYKYVKHPNYWVVFLELITIPLLFGAYITAVVFPVAHMLLMTKRIPLENEALKKYTQ